MRLLQPRLRILLYVYRRESVPDNITQLGRSLVYSKGNWTNDMINELIDGDYLCRTRVKGVL